MRPSDCCCCMCFSNSNKNITRMALFCMIQGLIWSACSVFFLAVQTCALRFEELEALKMVDAPNEIMYVEKLIHTAYLSGNCNSHSWDGFPGKSAETLSRTYYLLVIHGLLNALWIPLCVLLIVAVRSRLHGNLVAAFFYVPWLLVTFTIIVFDLIAGGFYVMDGDHSRSLLEFLTFIGYTNYFKDFTIPEDFALDSYTIYAPMFFVIFFTKGVIFTIVNIIYFAQILKLTRNISRERSQPLISSLDFYDDACVTPKYKQMEEHIPMQAYSASTSYLQWMEIYQPSDHQYEIIISPCKEYTIDNLFPTRTFQDSSSTNGGSASPDYISLFNYNDHQYAYENIWREIKNETITNVTHIYDYLGRPVAESKVAVKNNANNKDVNIRKGSMLTSMDLIQIEKIVNNNHKNLEYRTFRESHTSATLHNPDKLYTDAANLRATKSTGSIRRNSEYSILNDNHLYETIPIQIKNCQQIQRTDPVPPSPLTLRECTLEKENELLKQSETIKSSSDSKPEHPPRNQSIETTSIDPYCENMESSKPSTDNSGKFTSSQENTSKIVSINKNYPSYTNLPNFQDTIDKNKKKNRPSLKTIKIPSPPNIDTKQNNVLIKEDSSTAKSRKYKR